jgi:hypothetical protein
MSQPTIIRMVLAAIIFLLSAVLISLFLRRDLLPGILVGGAFALLSLGTTYFIVNGLAGRKGNKPLMLLFPVKLLIFAGILFLILKRGIIEPFGVIIGISGAPLGSLFGVIKRRTDR